jgi:hypothetical protein
VVWANSTDNTLIEKLMEGTASADKNHLQTTDLNFNRSKSLDDSLPTPYTTFDDLALRNLAISLR